MATDPITEIVATENQTVAQVPSFAMTQTVTRNTAPIVNVLVNHGENLEKFNGLNFKTWHQKMLFYLTTLNLARFLIEDAPKLNEHEGDIQTVSAVEAWKHSDFLCRNYVMNGLADSLYNMYSSMKTAKELWESLDCKYKTKDAGLRNSLLTASSIIKW
ncbi:zinc knuckle (CCHC-type) family protein [Abeliophyllum distichum]|uniref:Zinc knuckle (CCHC-type) family protein n=1 Tax=Abeliophyllum distichum TaxID=126358 RepID=A0ABD1RD18_9LAMI